ncbi:unnamed protein product [Caenorhabditis brenneri]
MSKEPASNENDKKPLLREGMTYEQFEVCLKKGNKTLKNWKKCYIIATIVRVLLFVCFVGFWVFEMIQEMKSDPKFSFYYDPRTLTIFYGIELCPVIWAMYFTISFFRPYFEADSELLCYFIMVGICTVCEIFFTAFYFWVSINLFNRPDRIIYISIYIIPVYFSLNCAYHGLNWFLVRKIQKVDWDVYIRGLQLENFYDDFWWENGCTGG